MLSRPKLGIATWIFGKRPLSETLAEIATMDKVDGVELWVDIDHDSPAQVKSLLEQHQLALFGLTPDNVDLANPDENIRASAIDYYKRLIVFAAELDAPRVLIRPFLGRERPLMSREEEIGGLKTAVSQLAKFAASYSLQLGFEVVNRYESHLINTGREAELFLQDIALDNLGVVLSTFHMNIEEQDAAGVIRQLGEKVQLLHMADSNRRGIGQGHLKLGLHLWAIQDLPHEIPIILDFLPVHTNPIHLQHTETTLAQLKESLSNAANWF
ncbi:MAG: sugar phosphate isomerase/epimerase [Chloroflexi bacterium]|nr:MAG: sugar phosphate isomerase/epimerase [Chloroflexota bacterium]